MAKINPKRTWTTQKIDKTFAEQMKELAKQRYTHNLEKKLPSIPEMTRLLPRTEAWKNAIFELKTKPRREDIRI
jgi:hypothetical protein